MTKIASSIAIPLVLCLDSRVMSRTPPISAPSALLGIRPGGWAGPGSVALCGDFVCRALPALLRRVANRERIDASTAHEKKGRRKPEAIMSAMKIHPVRDSTERRTFLLFLNCWSACLVPVICRLRVKS